MRLYYCCNSNFLYNMHNITFLFHLSVSLSSQWKTMERRELSVATPEEFVHRYDGKRVINKVLIANNGIAAVKCMRSIRRWCATFKTPVLMLLFFLLLNNLLCVVSKSTFHHFRATDGATSSSKTRKRFVSWSWSRRRIYRLTRNISKWPTNTYQSREAQITTTTPMFRYWFANLWALSSA